MSEKTVIARALKIESGSSDDSDLIGSNRQTDKVAADVKQEIKENANAKIVKFEEADAEIMESNVNAVQTDECPI